MNSPSLIDLPSGQPYLDATFKRHNLFSARVTGALIRQGIITPRILLMQTLGLLLRDIKNLGPKGLAEIESVLAEQGWRLAEAVDEKHVTATRLLVVAFSKVTHPLSLSILTQMVNEYSSTTWDETEIAEATASNPYIEHTENGFYKFHLRSIDDLSKDSPSDCVPKVGAEQENIDSSEVFKNYSLEQKIFEPELFYISKDGQKALLSKLWLDWLSTLNERQQKILLLCYGIQGEEPFTLQEVGKDLNLTRERVRQIKEHALRRLKGSVQYPAWQSMRQLLSKSIQQADNLLTPNQWEGWLDENAIWEQEEPRPSLLLFLSDVFSEFHSLNRRQGQNE